MDPQQEDDEGIKQESAYATPASETPPPGSPGKNAGMNINSPQSGAGPSASPRPVSDEEGLLAAINLMSLSSLDPNRKSRRNSTQQLDTISEDYISTTHDKTPMLLSEDTLPPQQQGQDQPEVKELEPETEATNGAAALPLNQVVPIPTPSPPFFDVTSNALTIIQPSTIYEFFCRPSASGYKGIKGHQNSCYMDSLLFSMFAFTTTFDDMFQEGKLRPGDDSQTAQIAHAARNLLSKHIVNVLREQTFCSSEAITEFRHTLSVFDRKFLKDYMDVEEVMRHIFKLWGLQPFLTYENTATDFLHQINSTNFAYFEFKTTQSLFEASLIRQNLRLMVMPCPALILVYPRWEGELVDFMPGVIPSLYLNLNHSMRNGMRQCIVRGFGCKEKAEFECRECFEKEPCFGMKATSFCGNCYWNSENHSLGQKNHDTVLLTTDLQCRREFVMELEAVICYKETHFVSFVKEKGSSAPWMFHDSNPVGDTTLSKYLPHMSEWIRELETLSSDEIRRRWTTLDPLLHRLLTDGHICIYRPVEEVEIQPKNDMFKKQE